MNNNNQTQHNGNFIISLDFELMWGVRDKKTIDNYGGNIFNVHNVIPKLVETFDKYNVKATFASVGFLFHSNKNELLNNLPVHKPFYTNDNLNPYTHFNELTNDTQNNKYYFASQLIDVIKNNNNHEVGTHTYCHYYCLEQGQNLQSFQADIECAVKVALDKQIQIKSLVFPRNQFNDAYLEICKNNGIIAYRGNPNSWIYLATDGEGQSNKLRRALRLIDAYVNISGHHTFNKHKISSTQLPVDLPASMFLRPYSKKMSFFERFRVKRIKNSMTYAAKHNLAYHLWWHPHNFGANLEHNFNILNSILQHYVFLNKKYNFQSITMENLAKEIISKND